MLFSEYWNYNSGEYVNYITAVYGAKVAQWIKNRFYNFVLLYDTDTFRRLFDNALIESDLLLLQIRRLQENSQAFILGTKTTAQVNANTESNSNNSNSYAGYNVEGDFTKSKSNNSGNSSTNSTTETINQLDEYIKLVDSNITNLFNKLYDKLIVLFVTLV